MTTTHHALAPEDRAPRAAFRALVGAAPRVQFVPAARPMFDELMGHTPAAPGVSYEEARVGGVLGWWCRPANALPEAAVVYLHGGAYVLGSAIAFRNFVGQVAARAGAAAFVGDYRRAPEHGFPGAVEDALAVYAGVAASGATRIAIAGDSAGGGLALVLLAHASKQRDGTRPRGAAVMSPWTDLALTGASLQTRAAADPLLDAEALATGARQYLGDHDPRDPRASPLHGDLAGLPPVRIHVGEDEVLLDDAVRYGEAVRAAGGTCEVHSWEGMAHVFPSALGTFAASELALADLGGFLRACLAG